MVCSYYFCSVEPRIYFRMCASVWFCLRKNFILVSNVNFTDWFTTRSFVSGPSIYSLLHIPLINSSTSLHSIIAFFISHFLLFGFSWSSLWDSVLVLISTLILFIILCIFFWIPDCLQALSKKLTLILLVFFHRFINPSWIVPYENLFFFLFIFFILLSTSHKLVAIMNFIFLNHPANQRHLRSITDLSLSSV